MDDHRASGAAGLPRRTILGLALATAFAPRLARAQGYPSRPIRLMVGVAPGGSIDGAARSIAPRLAELLQTTVMVENKVGASGVLNSEYVAKSAPDGYTLMMTTPGGVIIAPQAMPKATFRPLTDVVGVNMVSTSASAIVVNPKLEVTRIRELVALSRTRPISIGQAQLGSTSHLMTEMIVDATGANFLNVPYKGAAPALNDTIAGHVDATVADAGPFIPMHRAGRVRIIGVASERRLRQLPDVPTVGEDVPGLVVANWIGVFAPAGTPKPILDRLSDALKTIVTREDIVAHFEKTAATATAMEDQEQFQRFVASEHARYGRVLRERNIVVD